MGQITKILEGTFALILIYLLVRNADGVSQVTQSIGSVYTGSVKVLQGR